MSSLPATEPQRMSLAVMGALVAAGLVYALPGPWWLALVGALAVTALAVRWPVTAVALAPLTFPLTFWTRELRLPLPGGRGLELQPAPVEAIIACLLLAVIIRLILDRWPGGRAIGVEPLVWRWPPAWLALATGGLLAVATLSLFTVADRAHLRESLIEYRKVIVEPLLFAGLAWLTLRGERARWLALLTLLVAGALVGLYGAGQCLLGRAGVTAEGVCRAVGVYQHPNNLALLVGRTAAIGLALALSWPTAGGRWLAGALAGAAALGMVASFSRGGWFALLGTATLLLLWTGRRRLALGVAGLALALIVVLPLTGFARLNRLLDASGGSSALRLELWASTLAMLAERPLTGLGLDQFLYQYNPRYVAPEAWGERFTAHPHNVVLDFWVRLGILGLASGAALFGLVGRAVARLVAGGSPHQRSVTLAVGGLLVAGLLHGLVDHGFFLPDLALIFWLGATVVATAEASGPVTDPVRAGPGGR